MSRTTRGAFALVEFLEPRALMTAIPLSDPIDLIVADSGFSHAASQPNPTPGADYYIAPRVTLQGGSTNITADVAVYLSPIPTLTPQSILLYSKDFSNNLIANTPSGFGANPLANYGTLPSSVTPGTWYPIVVADPDDQTAESDETNNTLVGDPIQVVAPGDDLTPPAASLFIQGAGDNLLPAGSTVYAQFTAPYAHRFYPVQVSYSLSVDNVAGNSDDIPVGTHTLSTTRWAPGDPNAAVITGAAEYEQGAFQLPANLPPGTYHLVTTIDPDNAVAEPDETNNTTVGPDVTILPAGTIDLRVGSPILPSTTPVAAGSHLLVSAFVGSRFGESPAPTVAYYLSADDVYGNGDDVLLGSQSTSTYGPTPPGTYSMLAAPPTVDVVIPRSVTPGHYHVFAVVDPNHQLAEYDESNNVSAPSDLDVTAPSDPISPPAQPPAVPSRPILTGASARMPVTFTNPTAKPVRATYKVTFYRSADTTLSRTDKSFFAQTLTVTLKPHQTKSLHVQFQLPSNAGPGTFHVIAVATPPKSRPALPVTQSASGSFTIAVTPAKHPAAKSLWSRVFSDVPV